MRSIHFDASYFRWVKLVSQHLMRRYIPLPLRWYFLELDAKCSHWICLNFLIYLFSLICAVNWINLVIQCRGRRYRFDNPQCVTWISYKFAEPAISNCHHRCLLRIVHQRTEKVLTLVVRAPRSRPRIIDITVQQCDTHYDCHLNLLHLRFPTRWRSVLSTTPANYCTPRTITWTQVSPLFLSILLQTFRHAGCASVRAPSCWTAWRWCPYERMLKIEAIASDEPVTNKTLRVTSGPVNNSTVILELTEVRPRAEFAHVLEHSQNWTLRTPHGRTSKSTRCWSYRDSSAWLIFDVRWPCTRGAMTSA